ncbi:hypothetical protein ABTE40_20095, partial [Acinetobacter baumannii]
MMVSFVDKLKFGFDKRVRTCISVMQSKYRFAGTAALHAVPCGSVVDGTHDNRYRIRNTDAKIETIRTIIETPWTSMP